MTATSPMVILLLLVALGVAAVMVQVGRGRIGGGIALPPRSRGRRRAHRSPDLR